jgi:hypothetical protein
MKFYIIDSPSVFRGSTLAEGEGVLVLIDVFNSSVAFSPLDSLKKEVTATKLENFYE